MSMSRPSSSPLLKRRSRSPVSRQTFSRSPTGRQPSSVCQRDQRVPFNDQRVPHDSHVDSPHNTSLSPHGGVSYQTTATTISHMTPEEKHKRYVLLLVNSVNTINCAILYRALMKVERAVGDNKRAKHILARLVYTESCAPEHNYDNILAHLKEHMGVFLSIPEARQLVLYAGLFAPTDTSPPKRDDVILVCKKMQMRVPPLFYYKRWCRDVKRLEANRGHTTGYFSSNKRHHNACDVSETVSVISLESTNNEVCNEIVPNLTASKTMDDDDDEDYPLPPKPKPKLGFKSKFKQVAMGVMATLPSDTLGDIAAYDESRGRKKGFPNVYLAGDSPEYNKLVGYLSRGEMVSKEALKPTLLSLPSVDEESVASVHVGTSNAHDPISSGYFAFNSPSNTTPKGTFNSDGDTSRLYSPSSSRTPFATPGISPCATGEWCATDRSSGSRSPSNRSTGSRSPANRSPRNRVRIDTTSVSNPSGGGRSPMIRSPSKTDKEKVLKLISMRTTGEVGLAKLRLMKHVRKQAKAAQGTSQEPPKSSDTSNNDFIADAPATSRDEPNEERDIHSPTLRNILDMYNMPFDDH